MINYFNDFLDLLDKLSCDYTQHKSLSNGCKKKENETQSLCCLDDCDDELVFSSGFNDCGDKYTVAFEVDRNATADNFDVSVKHGGVEVKYCYETKNMTTKSTFFETLPKDADQNTLTAEIENGIVTIKVDKEKKQKPCECKSNKQTIKINNKE